MHDSASRLDQVESRDLMIRIERDGEGLCFVKCVSRIILSTGLVMVFQITLNDSVLLYRV